jgi:copper resistance protein B
MDHSKMDHGSMKGMDHGTMEGMDHGAMDHSTMKRR